MSDHPTCPTCVYFDRTDNSVGLCRLEPPTVIPAIHESNGDRKTKPFTTWPLVRTNDWCGEHRVNNPVPVHVS